MPGLCRNDVDPGIFSKQFHEVKGLARLLLLEHKRSKERTQATKAAKLTRHGFAQRHRSYQAVESDEDVPDTQILESKLIEYETRNPIFFVWKNYNAVFLLWCPELNAAESAGN